MLGVRAVPPTVFHYGCHLLQEYAVVSLDLREPRLHHLLLLVVPDLFDLGDPRVLECALCALIQAGLDLAHSPLMILMLDVLQLLLDHLGLHSLHSIHIYEFIIYSFVLFRF